MQGGARGLDLHLDVGRGPGVGRALESALREAVRTGRLAPGTRLPGTRSLAADLGISRGTVVHAFSQLVAEGWLVGTAGSGTVVSDVALARPEPGLATASPVPPSGIDLRPGRPDLAAFPRAAWAAAVRRVLAGSAAPLDYGDPFGLPQLRAALAAHVARTRGVQADAESVVVTAGFTQGLALLANAVHAMGMRAAASEDPGFAQHRQVLHAAGLMVAPLPVDAGGASPDALPDGPALALLTPAHQQPSGVVLAPARRAAAVAWARRCDGFVVEDDYDGEFRYDRQPVGAVQPLDPQRVVFGGSASKTLAPGMRIGWLVVPSALRGALRSAAEAVAAAVPAIDQLALADLLDSGGYDRHVRRARLAYRRRRDELGSRLGALGVTPSGVAAGLHALLPVGAAAQERRLLAAAGRGGLRLHGLHADGYWHRSTPDRPGALVVGYATPPAHGWHRALDALTALLQPT